MFVKKCHFVVSSAPRSVIESVAQQFAVNHSDQWILQVLKNLQTILSSECAQDASVTDLNKHCTDADNSLETSDNDETSKQSNRAISSFDQLSQNNPTPSSKRRKASKKLLCLRKSIVPMSLLKHAALLHDEIEDFNADTISRTCTGLRGTHVSDGDSSGLPTIVQVSSHPT